MAILGAKQKPVFLWQALLILLPVAAMAVIGWVATQRDKAAVEQEARQRAQELLRTLGAELGPRTLNQLAEFDLTAGEWFAWQVAKFTRLSFGILWDNQPRLGPSLGDSPHFQRWERANPGRRPEQVFPNWLWFDGAGRLAWPPEYEQPPRPPDWLLALSPEQRQLWGALQCARASTNFAEMDAARTQLLDKAPYSVPKACVDFLELEAKSAQEEPTNAVAKFLLFAQQHASTRSDSGIPLSNLAVAAALRAAERETAIDSASLALFTFLLQTPSALTGTLLEQTRDGARNDPVFREALGVTENIWLAQERLRAAAEVIRQVRTQTGDAGTNYWIELAGDRWFCTETPGGPITNQPAPLPGVAGAATPATEMRLYTTNLVWPLPLTSTPALAVRLYPKSTVADAVDTVLRATGILIPDYARLTIRLAGEPLSRSEDKTPTPGHGKILAELRCPLGRPFNGEPPVAADPDAKPSGSESAAPGRPAQFELQLALVDSERLFARQRQRTALSEGLILASALAAAVGLIAAYRAFRRQLRLNELKSNFVSSVSHELRAPIASVRLMAESLERGKIAEPSKQLEYFHFIVQECRRLSSLIENVLDFSRIEQGRKQYDLEPTNVIALLRHTVALMEPYAAEKKVHLSLVLPPEATSELQTQLDGKAIQQALINLIDNALKHSPAGEMVTLGLSSGPIGDGGGSKGTNPPPSNNIQARGIELWVEDHGPGIAPEEQEKIFERFYRSGSELRRQTQGVGIGLSIVKHIVEAHGGRVRVHSAIGQGSRFTMELPSRRSSAGGR